MWLFNRLPGRAGLSADRTTIIHFLTHLEVKFQEHFPVILFLYGLRRIFGDSREQKLSTIPDILQRLHSQVRLPRDSGFLAAMLIGFFTFFRSQISSPNLDSSGNLSRQDIVIRPWSIEIVVCWSKTIPFRQCPLLLPVLPVLRLPARHPRFPVHA